MKRPLRHQIRVTGQWLLVYGFVGWGACGGMYGAAVSQAQPVSGELVPLSSVLVPSREDAPFFHAIAEDQEKKLSTCKSEDECRPVHFLLGLAALYENRELAAHHFRKVVVSSPNSVLAGESRFWLWLLDVLNNPERAGMTSQNFIKRLVREIVEKELQIYELSGKIQHASVGALEQEVATREKAIDDLKGLVANLTKQNEQLKKEQSLRQDVQQELKASEKKVQELTNQLEALRRIDQEIREKAPPTRPSEKMAPNPELEISGEKDMITNGEGKK